MVGFRLRSWFIWDTMGGSDILHVELESPLAPGRKEIQKRTGWESWEMRARKRRAAPPRSSWQVDTCGAGRLGRLPHLCWSRSSSEHGHPMSSPRAASAGQGRAGTFVTQGNRMNQGAVPPPSWPKRWHQGGSLCPWVWHTAGRQPLGLAGSPELGLENMLSVPGGMLNTRCPMGWQVGVFRTGWISESEDEGRAWAGCPRVRCSQVSPELGTVRVLCTEVLAEARVQSAVFPSFPTSAVVILFILPPQQPFSFAQRVSFHLPTEL